MGARSRVHERILKDTLTTEFEEMEKKRQKINVQRHTRHNSDYGTIDPNGRILMVSGTSPAIVFS